MMFAVKTGEMIESTDGIKRNKNSTAKRAGFIPASL